MGERHVASVSTGLSPGESSDDDRISDDDRFADYGRALAQAVAAALPTWIEDAMARRLARPWPDGIEDRVDRAGTEAADQIGATLDELLALDLDQQWTNPLTVIRTAARYPSAILADLGVPPVDRDGQAAAIDPDDHYDLTPAAFADFGPEVHELGIQWGAAKAHLHLQRRREERR